MRSFEESLFVMRELKSTIDEFKYGTFCKDEKFFEKVVKVRTSVLEWAHDIVYIMRGKQFKGYENIDFSFNLSLPEDFDNFKLSDFQVEHFNQ